MADNQDFVAAREVLQELTKAGNSEVRGKEGRNLHFSGKRKGFGENFCCLQCPRLGAGNNQVEIDLQLFQGRRNLTKASAPAAAQIALFVGEFRGQGDGLGMSGDVQFHLFPAARSVHQHLCNFAP